MVKQHTRVTGIDVDRSARVVDPFPDQLRKRGVNCKGYGILFKFPMLDTALTIEAKGIYCYICSYAGSDSTAFPGRDKIMADLRMCKDAYYRHYQLLLDNDYLRVEQRNMGGNSHGFMKNVYEIVERPRKFAAQPHSPRLEDAYARIRSGGLHDGGFGYIPRAVMVDERLSVKAKALYGYYRSFSGAGAAACPEKKDLLYHLGISDKLYLRLMGELTRLGYITVTQRHIGGRLSVNDIHINTEPMETEVPEHTVQVIRGEGEASFIAQKQDTQKKDVQKQERQKKDTQKKDAIKKNANKNKSDQQQSYHQQSRPGAEYRGMDGLEKEKILSVLEREERIPAWWLGDREKIGICLQSLTDYDRRREEGRGETEPGSSYVLFLEALTDMLCARKPMELTGDAVSAGEVARLLERYVHYSFARGTLALYELEELVRERYDEGCRTRLVRNPLGYCKACIWNALKTGDAATRAEVAHDLG